MIKATAVSGQVVLVGWLPSDVSTIDIGTFFFGLVTLWPIFGGSRAQLSAMNRLQFLLNLSRLPQVTAVTGLRLDACLYDPPSAREPGKPGRTAIRGKRQPKPSARLTDLETQRQTRTISWYGATTRQMEIATGTALWYQSPTPPVPIRWMLVRGRQGAFEPRALLCSDQQADAVQIVEWFVLRWALEVTFHEVRTHLGVDNGRIWRSCAPRPPCWAAFPWSPFLRSNCLLVKRFPCVRLPGTTNPCPPFPIPWPSLDAFGSPAQGNTVQIPRALFDHLVETLAFTA